MRRNLSYVLFQPKNSASAIKTSCTLEVLLLALDYLDSAEEDMLVRNSAVKFVWSTTMKLLGTDEHCSTMVLSSHMCQRMHVVADVHN